MTKLIGGLAAMALLAPGLTFAQSYYGNYGYPPGYSPSYYGNYIQDPYGMPYYPQWGERYQPYPEYTWPTYNCGNIPSYTQCNDYYPNSGGYQNYGGYQDYGSYYDMYYSYPSISYPQTNSYRPQSYQYPQYSYPQMFNNNLNFNNNINNNNAIAIGGYFW